MKCTRVSLAPRISRRIPALLLLAATAAGAAPRDAEIAALNAYADKYARTFSLEGEPRQLCVDEGTALIASEKSREEGAQVVDRMIAKIDRFVDVEHIGVQEMQYVAFSTRAQGPVIRFYLCYLKAKVLKTMPIGGDRVAMPGITGNQSIPMATPGDFRRTASSAWQYVARGDANQASWEFYLEQQQRKNRAKTGKDFPVQEGLVVCEAQLKAADREALAMREADLARWQARVREAEQEGDARKKAGYLREVEARMPTVEAMREGRRTLTREVDFMAGNGTLTAAELRKELPRYNPKVSTVPARDEATICLLKLRLAQLEAKPGSTPKSH